MANKDDESLSSRSSRKHKSRFDRFLNWAIGIVIVLIVVIGGYLLINILNSPSDTASKQNMTSSKSEGRHEKAEKHQHQRKDKSSIDSTQAVEGQSQGESSQSSDSGSTTADGTENGPALTGPWKPIGTSQSEPHTTNYTEGSVDWNERVKAMSIATGISEDDMVVVWLGNGGAPDKSLGKVHAKGGNQTYDISLQWVTDKGWQPLSVTEEAG